MSGLTNWQFEQIRGARFQSTPNYDLEVVGTGLSRSVLAIFD